MNVYDETVMILSDLEWHCGNCELPGSQSAKTIQNMKKNGYKFDTTIRNQLCSNRFCNNCNRNQRHRRLLLADPVDDPITRTNLSQALKKHIKGLYNNTDWCDLRRLNPNELEIDHRFPEIRWSSSEGTYEHLSDQELCDLFIPLSRSNNLLKSRSCEGCKRTGARGYPFGIRFWYQGGPNWEYDEDDYRGCIGCFWYDPETWRVTLNNLLDF